MMTTLLPSWPLLSLFLFSSVVLAVTPGPGVFYIVTRSLVQGRSAGLVSVAAVALGNLGNVFAASVGLAALFALSASAFTLVKYAGACYLIYLGVRMWHSSVTASTAGSHGAVSLSRVFREGLFVALLNPKTTVFFAAFLPQFLSADAQPMFQIMLLGSIFVIIAAITDGVYAVIAGAISPALLRGRGARIIGRHLGGSLFIALGVYAALFEQRKAV